MPADGVVIHTHTSLGLGSSKYADTSVLLSILFEPPSDSFIRPTSICRKVLFFPSGLVYPRSSSHTGVEVTKNHVTTRQYLLLPFFFLCQVLFVVPASKFCSVCQPRTLFLFTSQIRSSLDYDILISLHGRNGFRPLHSSFSPSLCP